jgi:hypothetical protein
MGGGNIGLQCNGFLKACERFFQTPHAQQRIALVEVRLGDVRFEADGRGEQVQAAIELATLAGNHAEQVQRIEAAWIVLKSRLATGLRVGQPALPQQGYRPLEVLRCIALLMFLLRQNKSVPTKVQQNLDGPQKRRNGGLTLHMARSVTPVLFSKLYQHIAPRHRNGCRKVTSSAVALPCQRGGELRPAQNSADTNQTLHNMDLLANLLYF